MFVREWMPMRNLLQLLVLFVSIAPAWAAFALPVRLAHLDADPPAARVVSGEFDARFVAAPGSRLQQSGGRTAWWRIDVPRPVPAHIRPHLVLASPYLHRVEAWPAGEGNQPVRRSLAGRDADVRFSTRAIVLPLPQGLAAGQPVYLRVHSMSATPLPVTIESLEELHRHDLAHVTWRTFVLSMMLMLIVLALGLWIGVGERSYAFLFVTLGAQFLYLAGTGGEVRVFPFIADRVGQDLRLLRLFTALAAVASCNFVACYLGVPQRQPRLMQVLRACNWATASLMAATVFSDARWIATLGNLVLLVMMPGMFLAAAFAALRRQREGYFVLLSWTPMVVLAVLRVGELQRWWPYFNWMEYAIPACCVMSGLVLMTGVTYQIQQLRRDRDRAHALATYDSLTGALARPAIESRLADLADAARQDGRPLSLVFFDIDRFKWINDTHGHAMGDRTLRIVVQRARNRLRSDDLLGRFGGDEMMVVLPDTALPQATAVAEHLREAIHCRPISIDGTQLAVSLSLGVAQLQPGETAEHLIERADAALYASKSAGRNRVTGHRATSVTATRTEEIPT